MNTGGSLPLTTLSTDQDSRLLLRLLSSIEADSQVTQRSIARELGIALGLANSYLKRCVKTGLIKISQAPANRYAYYLTPHGFAEKVRLTSEFFRQSFNLVRAARQEYGALMALCGQRGWHRVVLCGAGDLGEMATLAANDSTVELVGFFDPHATIDRLAGLTVHRDAAVLVGIDAALVTELHDPRAMAALIGQHVAAERILAPRFLGLHEPPQAAGDEP
jgi:DNA-binding MarR family transcriptional regulator